MAEELHLPDYSSLSSEGSALNPLFDLVVYCREILVNVLRIFHAKIAPQKNRPQLFEG